MSAARLGGSIAWTLIMFLSVGTGGYALFLAVTGFQYVPPVVLANAFPSRLGLEAHITASGVALVIGAFQFLRSLRSRFPIVHRWSGRIYIAACAVGGVAGASIALFSSSGPIAGWGFFLLGIIWLITTAMAWTRALQKNFVDHERWMIRSFALTLAAVTLRIYLPIAIIQNQGEFAVDAYRAIAWLAWVPNLIVAELWIASRRKPKPAGPGPTTAPA